MAGGWPERGENPAPILWGFRPCVLPLSWSGRHTRVSLNNVMLHLSFGRGGLLINLFFRFRNGYCFALNFSGFFRGGEGEGPLVDV